MCGVRLTLALQHRQGQPRLLELLLELRGLTLELGDLVPRRLASLGERALVLDSHELRRVPRLDALLLARRRHVFAGPLLGNHPPEEAAAASLLVGRAAAVAAALAVASAAAAADSAEAQG